jgi:hypothetical protein
MSEQCSSCTRSALCFNSFNKLKWKKKKIKAWASTTSPSSASIVQKGTRQLKLAQITT